MKILALEFSSPQRSVAVVIDGKASGEASHQGDRAVPSFEMISRALEQAKLLREDIECLAIGLGPGSYTGIRAAIAIVQGWQLARSVKLIGISSVEVLAHIAQQESHFGLLNIAIDAQRGEFYLAQYEVSKSESKLTETLRLVPREEIQARASAGRLIVGPDAAVFPGGHALFPTAVVLGRLAEERTDFIPGEKLEPIYLRETNYVKAQPPRIARGD